VGPRAGVDKMKSVMCKSDNKNYNKFVYINYFREDTYPGNILRF
jgi:hypothetical protein